jgi:hypothetical protein
MLHLKNTKSKLSLKSGRMHPKDAGCHGYDHMWFEIAPLTHALFKVNLFSASLAHLFSFSLLVLTLLHWLCPIDQQLVYQQALELSVSRVFCLLSSSIHSYTCLLLMLCPCELLHNALVQVCMTKYVIAVHHADSYTGLDLCLSIVCDLVF